MRAAAGQILRIPWTRLTDAEFDPSNLNANKAETDLAKVPFCQVLPKSTLGVPAVDDRSLCRTFHAC